MKEGLKIRINNIDKMERHITKLGARYSGSLSETYTYFNQPKSGVLKITENENGSFLVKIKSKKSRFEIIKNEKIKNSSEVKRKFSEKFGIKCVLINIRKFYIFENYRISLNLIYGIGKFLIVEGENLSPGITTEKLKIKNPEFITVSFDELKE